MRKAVFAASFLTFMFPVLLLNVSLGQETLHFTLDECVDMTLENNEQILKARQDLTAAEGVLMSARSDEYLQMNFTSWYERSKSDGDFETKDYNGTLSAEQLLMRFGEVPGKVDEAQERCRLAELGLQSARLDTVDKTRRIFYDIVLAQEEIREREILRAEIVKKRDRAKGRLDEDRSLPLDLASVELELADQDLSINALKRALRVKKTELLQAIGADEEADIEISGESSGAEPPMDDCIKAAMANRVELMDLRGQIQRQERIARETLWEFLPELRSSYRYKDTSVILRQQDRTWDALLAYEKALWEKEGGEDPERDKWQFSLGLSFPIFDGFRVKGVMQAEKALLEKLKIELVRKEKQIRLEVKSAYHNVADQKERMDILERKVLFRGETVEGMEFIMENPPRGEKYRYLVVDFVDVIEARENYMQAQKNYFDQKRIYTLARENLRQTMGVIK